VRERLRLTNAWRSIRIPSTLRGDENRGAVGPHAGLNGSTRSNHRSPSEDWREPFRRMQRRSAFPRPPSAPLQPLFAAEQLQVTDLRNPLEAWTSTRGDGRISDNW